MRLFEIRRARKKPGWSSEEPSTLDCLMGLENFLGTLFSTYLRGAASNPKRKFLKLNSLLSYAVDILNKTMAQTNQKIINAVKKENT